MADHWQTRQFMKIDDFTTDYLTNVPTLFN